MNGWQNTVLASAAVVLVAAGTAQAGTKPKKEPKVQCCLKKEGCTAEKDWTKLTEAACKEKGGTMKAPEGNK